MITLTQQRGIMSRRKISIVYNNCPRCGKQTAGLSRSIHGSVSCHHKFKGLCSDCVTKEEMQEILENQASGILKALADKNKGDL